MKGNIKEENIMKKTYILLFCLLFFTSFSGCISGDREGNRTYGNETETLFYQDRSLTPISDQRNNAIRGTQYIDRESYLLEVGGLVETPRNFSYEDLMAFPRVSRVIDLNCVEGWGFTAKWTGFRFADLFEEVGGRKNATTTIFYSADGYSTALELDYLLKNDIILAYKLNDVTLTPERGFPLQLVAEDKYGYKWAKWITGIEITDSPYRGYWEQRGYNNRADVGGPAFERRK